MAWTAGVTRTTGDLITAADWNSYLGASGSLDYLKDAINNASVSSPGRNLDTIYQNSTKIRIVMVSAMCDHGEAIKGLIGSGTPPVTETCRFKVNDATGHQITGVITFIVPAGYYYEVETTGAATKLHWYEADLM